MENFSKTELENEKWKDIFGYDGLYEVSDLGRVRSRKSGEWKVLRPGKDKDGYLIVGLRKDGKRKWLSVHRLVASYFVENDNIFNTEVNHINEDKTDNRVSNLEWCDRSYNLAYNGLRYRRITKIDKIKPLYSPELSIKQNLEIFRANGIKCSRHTLWKLRQELGLAKKYKK